MPTVQVRQEFSGVPCKYSPRQMCAAEIAADVNNVVDVIATDKGELLVFATDCDASAFIGACNRVGVDAERIDD